MPTHRRNKPVQEFVDNGDFALDRKIKTALADVKPGSQWLLMELPRDEDKELIADFILDYPNDRGNGHMMRPNTKKNYIDSLVYLSRHHKHKKSFKDMTRHDIIDSYLNSLKKSFEQDPEEGWINTHNNRASCYLAFWKWLTQQI
jgi:hypothetical protein